MDAVVVANVVVPERTVTFACLRLDTVQTTFAVFVKSNSAVLEFGISCGSQFAASS